MLKYYLFNLYILIILYNKNKGEDSIKYLILPFRTEIQEITKDNYLSIYYDNKIFIDIEVGTPPQKIPINLKFENYPFFIISSQSENLPKKYFNETKSSSYKKIHLIHIIFHVNYSQNVIFQMIQLILIKI